MLLTSTMCSLTIWLMGCRPQALLVLGSRLKSWYIRCRSAARYPHSKRPTYSGRGDSGHTKPTSNGQRGSTVCLSLSQQGPATCLFLVKQRCLVICQKLLIAFLQQFLFTNLVEVCMHTLRLLLQSLLSLHDKIKFSAQKLHQIPSSIQSLPTWTDTRI